MSRRDGDPIEIECYGPVARAVHWAVAALTHRLVRRNRILDRMLPLRRPG